MSVNEVRELTTVELNEVSGGELVTGKMWLGSCAVIITADETDHNVTIVCAGKPPA